MTFNNPEIYPQWREAWKAKEDALWARYIKTLENLTEHSRSLPPLRHGDHVLIQNQTGRFPTRWDRSGIVVEMKPHDQYVVKTSETGRLTLRNRRFLRKYTAHNIQAGPVADTFSQGQTMQTLNKEYPVPVDKPSHEVRTPNEGNDDHNDTLPSSDVVVSLTPSTNDRWNDSKIDMSPSHDNSNNIVPSVTYAAKVSPKRYTYAYCDTKGIASAIDARQKTANSV